VQASCSGIRESFRALNLFLTCRGTNGFWIVMNWGQPDDDVQLTDYTSGEFMVLR